MHHFKALRTISLILGFVLVISFLASSCATVKNVNKTDSGLSLTATGTSEGILLQFKNIPKDTNGLNITLWDTTEVDYLQRQVYIKGDELSEIRETQELLCPFVKNGHQYRVQVFTYSETNHFSAELYTADAVASGGIYPVNNLQLNFVDEYKSVTLSAKPIFSDEVVYAKDGLLLYYYISVHNDDGGYMHSGGEEWINELMFDFPWKSNETKPYFKMPGNIYVDATVRCMLKYGNIEWDVGVVKTSEENVTSL